LLAVSSAHAAKPPDDENMKGAVPLSRLGTLPSTADQYRALQDEIAKTRPGVEDAKRKSDTLKAEALGLKQRLVTTAAQVQALEDQKGRLDKQMISLAAEEQASSLRFIQDRAKVARLLAVLERLQQDMPPVMVMRPDDALSGSRGAMMLGAALPRIYKAAKELSQRLAELKKTRAELVVRRAEGARNEVALSSARSELDQLLAMKTQEADEASSRYGDLAAQLDSAAGEAGTLGSLLSKVAALRGQHPAQSVVVVAAQNVSLDLRHSPLLRPVVGKVVRGDAASPGGEHAPGVSFLAPPSARVVAPTDCQVLFAGRYHKTGQVLILESAGGYDLVLAGLERVDVRSGDALLAGEPLGTMPSAGPGSGPGTGSRLYFELRQNGKGVSPAPWLEIDLRKAKRS
jgi:septal ring factor EnvC (AmiA/AmiB activator)